MVLKRWEGELPLADRVILNLVCKRFANDMPIPRKNLPRLPGPVAHTVLRPSTIPRHLADQATAVKRNRLNFLQRLAPWFDSLTIRSNIDILTIEESRRLANFADVPALVVVDAAWVLCVACLKYQKTTTVMLDVNAANKVDPREPGQWNRCVIPRWDAKEGLKRLAAQDIDLSEVEKFWMYYTATPKSVPGYFDPKSMLKKMVKKVNAPAVERKKGRAKVKMDTVESAEVVVDGDGRKWLKKYEKPVEALTGFEECTWLPVNLSGEREAVFAVCSGHTLDPLHFIGI